MSAQTTKSSEAFYEKGGRKRDTNWYPNSVDKGHSRSAPKNATIQQQQQKQQFVKTD